MSGCRAARASPAAGLGGARQPVACAGGVGGAAQDVGVLGRGTVEAAEDDEPTGDNAFVRKFFTVQLQGKRAGHEADGPKV